MKKQITLEKEWKEYHCSLYNSAINTNTIYDWWKNKLLRFIADEINIAREEGQATSRLTSLINKICNFNEK